MAGERPRLIDHINPSLRAEVQAHFPLDYIERYEVAMHEILRLQHNRDYLPIKPGFQESDLDHTCAMLDMLQELADQYNYLPREVNFRDTAFMIAMHDAGELVVGDGPPFGPERESQNWKKRKRIEPKAAMRIILGQIPDETLREEMSHLYHRFARQNPRDREALLTRYIDKAQGCTRTGPSFAFDYRALGHNKPWYELIDHVQNSTSIFVDTALNLHGALSEQAGAELCEFTANELGRFNSIGFRWLVRPKTQRFLNSALGQVQRVAAP